MITIFNSQKVWCKIRKQLKTKISSLFAIFTKSGWQIINGQLFFQLGNKIFRKIFVIPIRSDPAAVFAKLLLYYYKSKGIKEIRNVDIRRAKQYVNTSRFADDLLILSNGAESSDKWIRLVHFL